MPQIIVLGSGTSTGVPEVGCHCEVCSSVDTRDKRLRSSLLYITEQGKRILIDCGPDFRQQAIRTGIDRLDAILLTHEHYDHIGGLDDLRTISWDRPVPIYAEERVLSAIRERLHYYFREHPYPGSPKLELIPISPATPFVVADTEVLPIRVMHGRLPILGFRIEDLAYVTDLKTVSPVSLKHLQGLQMLFINGLRYKPHPTHQTIDEALQIVAQLGRPQTYITHLSHHAPPFEDLVKELPFGVQPAYDQLTLHHHEAPFRYADCAETPYEEALSMQQEIFDRIIRDKMEGNPTHSVLMFCEHEPVLTIGRHGDETNLLVSENRLRSQGIRLHHIARGGDITYHGPGQITGYPIFDLETFGIGIKSYVELIESCIIELLRGYGIEGQRISGATGVWVSASASAAARKICAIGVRASRYVVMHGFALNVNTDLSYFNLINPCGFTDRGVCSISSEVGHPVDMEEVKQKLQTIFFARFAALIKAKKS